MSQEGYILTGRIIQIAVATDNESGDIILALTSSGQIYEQKSKTFYQARRDKGMYGNAFRTCTQQVSYWEQVSLALEPAAPEGWYEDVFTAQARENIVDVTREEASS